ncbi:Glutamate--cysteine ligase, GCS2 (plasmid) [Legionella adelaidensis]|uniref:Glutamate--cysteine ligase, GCS2 n=1 Tax=Legionella adelaidensis TaxID=45056 RepID=A0A0W0R2N1_9GAMM|nr:glutamate-cysteine ligase family protein [Legionella adelaidensis]KTC65257.1 Glutamate--cysteine ligase, GCS2 [Legionella adelaidensis]VEH86216.1 Glutamate--cysteine ligase, GCS2 [Legionella adelaidensis]
MSNFSLFSVLGIEIEYMLVDNETLNVRPISDLLLKDIAGKIVNQAELGDIAVSNELVMHVLELKNNGPKPVNIQVAEHFQKAIEDLQPILKKHHLKLLPTGAHPWMDPHTETKRWPYDNEEIYRQYNTIFNCQGHGWANLQSMHINMPFANDEEFFHLHSLIRLILPLIPALSASTPILDGKKTGFLDARLSFYEQNQRIIPEISGDIIPEFVRSKREYEEKILQPMYRAIDPHDPNKILQYEWLNSRGAIAKFDYNAIEIRIVDTQENVNSDIAIAHLIHHVLKSWHETSSFYLDKPCDTSALKEIYDRALKEGLTTIVEDGHILEQWQLPRRRMSIRDIWSQLLERVSPSLDKTSQLTIENIIRYGNLSERILRSCQNAITPSMLKNIYEQLAFCLIKNQQYLPS